LEIAGFLRDSGLGTRNAAGMGMPGSNVGDPETYAIIGAAMEVHREFGCGFLEAPYHRAMLIELGLRGIAARTQVPFRLTYKEQDLKLLYRADLVCFESVLVEIKAVAGLGGIEQAQAINYLRVSGLTRALVLNFGGPSLEYRRIVSADRPGGRPARQGMKRDYGDSGD
jgi:GxxExxY protein